VLRILEVHGKERRGITIYPSSNEYLNTEDKEQIANI